MMRCGSGKLQCLCEILKRLKGSDKTVHFRWIYWTSLRFHENQFRFVCVSYISLSPKAISGWRKLINTKTLLGHLINHIHHYPILSITIHHYPSLSNIIHYCPSLSIHLPFLERIARCKRRELHFVNSWRSSRSCFGPLMPSEMTCPSDLKKQ